MTCATLLEKAAVAVSDPEPINLGNTQPIKDRQDALRYRWLVEQFCEGYESYLGEWVTSKEQLDVYIDKNRNQKVK